MYFLIHPLVWINDERMAVHCLESGCIGLYIPSDLKISLGPRDVPRASPSGHLSGLGKSLGRRGCTTQYIPTRGSVRIQYNKDLQLWSFYISNACFVACSCIVVLLSIGVMIFADMIMICSSSNIYLIYDHDMYYMEILVLKHLD